MHAGAHNFLTCYGVQCSNTDSSNTNMSKKGTHIITRHLNVSGRLFIQLINSNLIL